MLASCTTRARREGKGKEGGKDAETVRGDAQGHAAGGGEDGEVESDVAGCGVDCREWD